MEVATVKHILIASCICPGEDRATFGVDNLQTLYKAANFVCSEKILEKIPNLKKLGILYNVDDKRGLGKEYELNNLASLQYLEDLKTLRLRFVYFISYSRGLHLFFL